MINRYEEKVKTWELAHEYVEKKLKQYEVSHNSYSYVCCVGHMQAVLGEIMITLGVYFPEAHAMISKTLENAMNE